MQYDETINSHMYWSVHIKDNNYKGKVLIIVRMMSTVTILLESLIFFFHKQVERKPRLQLILKILIGHHSIDWLNNAETNTNPSINHNHKVLIIIIRE